ncbi:MAG: MCP four helix bundle domain-containing protein, partial [Pseudomonadota bacterium]
MFANMKISARLSGGFAIVILLMVAIAVIGISRLAVMNDSIGLMVNDRYPKTVTANHIIDEMGVNARAMRNALLVKSEDQVRAELARVEKSRASIVENFDKLKASITSEKGKEILKKALDVRVEFVKHQDAFLELVKKGQRDEAIDLLVSKIRQSQGEYFDAVSALIEYQGSLMTQAGQDAIKAYEDGRNLMISLAVIALLLAAFLAFWIMRSITRPLNEAMTVANRLANGDLTVRVNVTSNDEVGQLLMAMRDMVEKLTRVVTDINSAVDGLSSASEEVSATAQTLSQGAS